MLSQMVANLNPGQTLALLLASLAIVAGTTISVAGIIASALSGAAKTRARATLTGQMIDRGMSADEIAGVLGIQGHDLPVGGVPLSTAAEAVVRNDDEEWVPALILQVAEGRYLAHYVGESMDENEWVSADRVRFPAGSGLPGLMADLSSSRASAYRNGTPGKPPVELEV